MGVRLEDLKDKPEQTLAALCKWMGINNNESLYEMTAQGKRWWGDPSSPDYFKGSNGRVYAVFPPAPYPRSILTLMSPAICTCDLSIGLYPARSSKSLLASS